jgi:hypothetical protein
VTFSPGAAGTYGSASLIPVVTVDTYGRVTGATTATPSGGGSGTVSSGAINQVAFYAAAGTTVSGYAGLTYVAGGALTCSNDIIAYSDARKKKNIQKITDALSKLKSINGYTYEFTETIYDRRNAGVLAQEVQAVLPEVVYDNNDGTLSVAYGNMASLFIEAIKELEARVSALENK